MANPIIKIIKESPSLRKLTTVMGLYYSFLLIALIYLSFDYMIDKITGDDDN